jgi:hypothetical protein
MTETVAIGPETEPDYSGARFVKLAEGPRLVRLETPVDLAWLREYRVILRAAARDFLKRSHLEGDPDVVLEELGELLQTGGRGAVWLIVDPEYRLLGFSAVRIGRAAWSPESIASVLCCYLFPRKTPRSVFGRLWIEMIRWARGQGAQRGYFQTRRGTRRAWARHGATLIGALYQVDLAEPSGSKDGPPHG